MARSGRLRLEGGSNWSSVDVLEIHSTGLLIATPLVPALTVGAAREFSVWGRRGLATITAAYPPTDGRAFYAVRITEYDPGVVDAIELAVSRRHCRMHLAVQQSA